MKATGDSDVDQQYLHLVTSKVNKRAMVDVMSSD